ncbi:prephenate dehydratase [Halobacillus naozhouensis]|uniref:Prephenate dehydratase n=1 Tax=Halobacillus naozhouensis TaxID=554880 RepID=A0ABY8ITL1_9BACI|nr:prephenate dehydratase [Halobacillus naozhouensis]WFT73378.1 prephenate dehydratase [Halobacillus naozhouensis]
MQRVGYLGPKGTFTKMAVDAFFEEGPFIGYENIPACLEAVERGDVDLGVVPLENSIEGSVHLTIDYLIHEVNQAVVTELTVPIRQHFLVHPDYNGEELTHIYSHNQAIAQCQQYLYKKYPEAEIAYTASTAKAAEVVVEQGVHTAAIGNHLAAEQNGLNILTHNIHDYDNNHTRFAVVQNTPVPLETKTHKPMKHKTTVMITLPKDYVGALHQVLSAFAWRKMNLSKIESRPMKTGLGNYFFLIDVDQPYDEVLFPGVKAELEMLGCTFKLLGTYPSYLLEMDPVANK